MMTMTRRAGHGSVAVPVPRHVARVLEHITARPARVRLASRRASRHGSLRLRVPHKSKLRRGQQRHTQTRRRTFSCPLPPPPDAACASPRAACAPADVCCVSNARVSGGVRLQEGPSHARAPAFAISVRMCAMSEPSGDPRGASSSRKPRASSSETLRRVCSRAAL